MKSINSINIELAKNITRILAEFDFSTTVELFKVMGTKWIRDDEERFPTLDDVRDCAEYLLWNVIEYAYEHNENFTYSESGCFRAEYHKEHKEEYVELIFEPCSWRKIA